MHEFLVYVPFHYLGVPQTLVGQAKSTKSEILSYSSMSFTTQVATS